MWICGINVEDSVVDGYLELLPTREKPSRREAGRRIANAYKSSLPKSEVYNGIRHVPVIGLVNHMPCYLLSPKNDKLHTTDLVSRSEHQKRE